MHFYLSSVCGALCSNVRRFGTSRGVQSLGNSERTGPTVWKSTLVWLGFAGATVVGGATLNIIDQRMRLKGNYFQNNRHRRKSPKSDKVPQWTLHGPLKVVWLGIVGTCVTTLILKKFPQTWRHIDRYFVSFSHSKRYFPIFLSNFNHASWLHLGINLLMLYQCVALYGVGTFSLQYFLIAGLFSSLVSYHFRTMLFKNISRSVGFTGALYAMLGYYAYFFPHKPLRPFNLPFINLPIKVEIYKLYGIAVAVDIVCILVSILSRRSFFLLDPFVHIGGAVFGLISAKFYVLRRIRVYTLKLEQYFKKKLK